MHRSEEISMTQPALRPRPAWATADGHIAASSPRALGTPALDSLLAVETVYRFALAFGERDHAVLTDCFTSDATFDATIGGEISTGLYSGRDAIVEWLTSYWPRQTDQRRHFVTDPVVDVVGADRVTVTTWLVLAASENSAMRLVTAGFYRCELVLEADAAWRIETFRGGYDAPY
jgi:hypothetical protein